MENYQVKPSQTQLHNVTQCKTQSYTMRNLNITESHNVRHKVTQ